MTFRDFLTGWMAQAYVSTDDVLASFLPLMRETIDAHRSARVAPLEGVEHLGVDGSRLWFEEAKRQPIRRNDGELARLEQASRVALDVLTETRRTSELADGNEVLTRAEIGERGAPPVRPVYLRGYVAWEHELAHHDPLTDVFSLGTILASLACKLNFEEPDDLEQFVAGRRNLFGLNADLHPALAQAILRMTELDRHRRAQDLPALLASLENYRDQSITFDIDLARLGGLGASDRPTRSQAVLTRLRDRLFDVSRRNSLLYFRATAGSLNLTQASIPLLLDIRNIRDDQLLVWSDELRRQLVDGKPISLNKRLNFAEALYLPSLVERIMADARRDQQEYGFAQLRLVICFLSWANLKIKPAEPIVSPLVLLPVKLAKSKGIRDTYSLEALSSEAEINPVVRHQFRQLYDIELPQTVDLAEGGLDALVDYMTARIQASEPAVTVDRIARPRIDLIHDKARRRLDQYRRSARLSGRGVRHFLNLDYSYDPANYHPLGIKLFAAKVRTPATRLREIIEERPRPRSYSVPEPAADENTVEVERSFYQLRDASEQNPYLWNFDLCSLTLANFHYRRMSLVRDYEAILRDAPANAAFEATFSLLPRPAGRELPQIPPLDERFDVVPCDPTQATAIAEARREQSYIVQGPPGTGKSQTITNLIADFVARGRRVLFVCEKRAAIDVVYARLRQCGLGSLCALVHDSQSDKKEFVLDLKRTYEELLEPKSEPGQPTAARDDALADVRHHLGPLERFEAAMQSVYEPAALPARSLLDRCLALGAERPELTPEENERLPHYAAWWNHRDELAAFETSLGELQHDGVLAHHPLRRLAPSLAEADQPINLIKQRTERAGRLLDQLMAKLDRCGVPAQERNTLERIVALVDYARHIEPLARLGNLPLVDGRSGPAKSFAAMVARVRKADAAVAAAARLTTSWRKKLSAADLASAIEQARRFEGNVFAWLSLSWWRLRGVLNRSYDFRSHAVRPGWMQVLTTLQSEYVAQAAADAAREAARAKFQLEQSPYEVETWIDELRPWLASRDEWLRRIHQALLQSAKAREIVERIVAAEETLFALQRELADVVVDCQPLPLAELRETVEQIGRSARQAPQALAVLGQLSKLPPEIARTLRDLPFAVDQAEAAVAHRTWNDLCQGDRSVAQFGSKVRQRHVARLETLYDQWLKSNAAEVCRRVRERFLEHVQTTSLPAAQLTPAEREFKKSYAQGRRTLEHEFGKSMRYKAIRELVDGEPGMVLRDLKPVWLMSPLSVSDTLPMATDLVDVVIFDEASQVPLEEAMPALFRGKQTIVVGDEMQLPPTDFFSVKAEGDDEELVAGEGDERVRFDLSSDSFLNHAAKNLPSTMLGWHYRSRSESLVSFSNWAFYDGRLLTVPDERLAQPSSVAQVGRDLLLSRPLSFHHLPRAVYDKRRNAAEAEYIAHLVADVLKLDRGLSVGVIAFSEAQQDEIDAALKRLADEDDEFRPLYEAELEREDDGQFVGLLVKNLENIQGDERDVIILSICYGPGPNGRMLMNFGPINTSGGEKRLNVAFSRAKHFMAVVSSIRHGQITNDYNVGAACLKNYLRYAAAMSDGDVEAARRVLTAISRWRDADGPRASAPSDPLTAQIAAELRERGYVVDEGVGQSHFRVDLAVRKAEDAHYRLGILVDTLAQYEDFEPLERDVMRPRLLRNFGWKIATVLGKDWYEDPQKELSELLRLLEE